jgi:hypothetical protein
MTNLKAQVFLMGAIGLLGMANSAMATAIGTLDLGQCGGGGVTVTATTITWAPPTLGGTAGCTETGLGTNVTYSGGTLGAGVTGNILNLAAGGGAVDDFITFGTLDFVLTAVGPGVSDISCGTIASGQTCSVFAGSPFILTNNGNGSTGISLPVVGTVTDGGVTTSWFGSFSTQVPQTPGAIQNTELTPGGSISSTYAGDFTVSSIDTPEPSTAAMFLVGALVLLGVGWRRREHEQV